MPYLEVICSDWQKKKEILHDSWNYFCSPVKGPPGVSLANHHFESREGPGNKAAPPRILYCDLTRWGGGGGGFIALRGHLSMVALSLLPSRSGMEGFGAGRLNFPLLKV